MSVPASYTFLTDTDWDTRIAAADTLARACALCPRHCGVNRIDGEEGYCASGCELKISSVFPHHGEEPPISGSRGSGTVFFAGCTLGCCFCQNYQISQLGEGEAYSVERLAGSMLGLQALGCHNVNLVTATHFLPWVLGAVRSAALQGLTIPLVYNCSGYESVDALAVLRGIVDIYLPDMKYGDNASALRYSRASDYVERNQAAIREMFRQVGPLKVDAEGIARRGLCIRHLVLPDGNASSKRILDFLTTAFDPADISVSLMAQYRPLHRACEHPEINRMVTIQDYEVVRKSFVEAGFTGFFQEAERLDESFVIDFTTRKSEPLKGE